MIDNNEIEEKNQQSVGSDEIRFEEPQNEEPKIEETPDEVSSPETPMSFSDDQPPAVYQENKNQYLMVVAGGIIFFIVLIFIIKGIFFSGRASKKEVKLTYWGLWEEKQVMQPLIDDYQRKNPNIKIDYQKLPVDSFREKLIARSKNNQGPDIFRFHNTWVPELKEVLAPLPPQVMSNEEYSKTFYKIHQDDLKIGSYFYGLPLMVDGLVLVYNDSLLKKAGITNGPVTWDDVTDIVPKLTVKDQQGNLITSGIAIGTTGNLEFFSDIFGLLLAQNGGSLDKLDHQEAAGALEIFRKFAEPPNEYWDESMPNSTTAFTQEKVGMIIVPSWELLLIKSANPDIHIKVVPVPSVPGVPHKSLASYWVEGVSRFSKNQIEAWKFLKYLTEKETMTKLYEIQNKQRLFGEPYSRIDLAPLLSQNEYLGAVIKQAPDFVSLPVNSRTFDNGLNDGIIKYIENAINSTSQGVSYSEALKTAKQGISQIFSKYDISQ